MNPLLTDLLIENFSPRGFGQAGAVEVAHAIPGDRVRVEMRRKTKRVKKGKLVEILSPSSDRIEPRCQHASICGGCSWQSMTMEAQHRHKEEFVRRAFRELPVSIEPIIGSESLEPYRNKMEFSFSENRAGSKFLGLMIAHAEPYVYNVEHCSIAPHWMSECLARVRLWWDESGLKAYHPPADSGSLRYLTLREGSRTGQRMAILNVSGNPAFAPPRSAVDRFASLFDDPTSVFLRVHQQQRGIPTRFYEMHLKGPDHLIEELHLSQGRLRFKISPSSFFQTNTRQAEKLYDVALRPLTQDRPGIVYDLYCGTGTLGIAAAAFSQEVIGVELSSEAILDAEANAALNGISNARFIAGDVGKILRDASLPRPDTIIVDPPRAGLDPAALEHLKALSPKKIIYVSCNPLTQADNIKALLPAGFQLISLQPVDQFPYTAHVETVALLKSLPTG